MSGRFVRASKYRHVFGRSTKKEQCYDNLRISKNAWDTNLIKANPSYLSVNWEASGGGAFAVIPLEERGRAPDQLPLFRGHTAAVLDTDWSPFDDSFIASSSDDGKVLLWKVPEDFSIHKDPEEIQDVTPVGKLTGHSRKVGHVLFNPSAQNVLASASGDYSIKIWDVDQEAAKLSLKHADIVQSLSWSANGSLLVTTSRDKKLRVWDARQETPVLETAGHTGAKNSRAVWMGELDRIATTGFSKMSDRQLALWDIRASGGPIDGFQILDQISGVCMPFWDDGTKCLYLAGKGDGNIRYYEYENDKFEYLSQHSSPDPQRGVAFVPKRGVNTHENEVMRAYRTVNDSLVEPVSFIVPRRAEVFQGDIYPPTVGLKPAMSAGEWIDGREGMPPKISLESLFEGQAPQEVPSNYKPTPTSPKPMSPKAAATPVASPAKREPEPATPTITRDPPPTMKDNQSSIATAADKFKESSESSSDDDTSSFEEVSKPAERPVSSAVPPPSSQSESRSISTATKPTSQPESATLAAKPSSTPATDTSITPTATPPTHRQSPSTSSITGSATDTLKNHLREIKDMLEIQHHTILKQNEKLDLLTREVENLKASGGAAASSDASKDEKIRMLELELEEARS